ncbi:cation:proton antiporter [Desulfoscipio gibsoniae]|uniref:Kef-type K+ transport system, membrane component n=1 Tax=Desulfoscipio gibsoniae DSM 7213 TaxID=767817 RepID=R4KTW4_9FIRM|nr:cation:proton antiporter [Desulfoscipio gibsoniae]AGL03036.1 Kef-type K+ transport system, membrane component [Desulfoscipio gibsoniae DSM 7213]
MNTDLILNLGLSFTFITLAIYISNKIKFSSIPFLIMAGMLVGPHAPEALGTSLAIVHKTESIDLLARLGVLLMLFYLGLEFSTSKLAAAGSSLIKGGTVYVGLNFVRGVIFGWIFFQAWPEAFVVAGITGISSSAIITKLLVDLKRTANPETEFILGIMVFEDVFLAIYLSVLSGLLFSKGDVELLNILPGMVLIFVFIISIIVLGKRIGKLLEPRLSVKSAESFVVIIFTLLLLTAILVETIHIAEAIGALLLGLVLAETIHSKRVIQFISPMRDLFGAVFFFSFGLDIDYRLFGGAVSITLAAVLMTVLGNIITGLLASWLAGYKSKRGFNVAFTIIARGEFAIIVASLAATAGVSEILPAFAALYVLILAFISPVLAKNSRLLYEKYSKFSDYFFKPGTQKTN